MASVQMELPTPTSLACDALSREQSNAEMVKGMEDMEADRAYSAEEIREQMCRDLRAAIEEVQRMKADPTIGKTYSDVDAMMEDLLA